MLTIEEYIGKRKREDEIDELDGSHKIKNIQVCISYIFEYFDVYIGEGRFLESSRAEDKKTQYYRKQLGNFEPEMQEWLIDFYLKSGKYLDRSVMSIIKEDCCVLLYTDQAEFRSLSYDCYARIIKTAPQIKGLTDQLHALVVEVLRHMNLPTNQNTPTSTHPDISTRTDNWVKETWMQYNVNLLLFAHTWLMCWFRDSSQWSPSSRRRTGDRGSKFEYEYDFRHDRNPFGINQLYSAMPKKPFLVGRKKAIEEVLQYIWTSQFCPSDEFDEIE